MLDVGKYEYTLNLSKAMVEKEAKYLYEFGKSGGLRDLLSNEFYELYYKYLDYLGTGVVISPQFKISDEIKLLDTEYEISDYGYIKIIFELTKPMEEKEVLTLIRKHFECQDYKTLPSHWTYNFYLYEETFNDEYHNIQIGDSDSIKKIK